MSTLSREENYTVVSSEDSSSYPDESDLELGLELSLGGKARAKLPARASSWDRYARILTADDFSTVVSTKANNAAAALSPSSSSSSAPVAKASNNVCCGTKRAAEPPSSPPTRSAISQVVGWPPISNRRRNTFGNQSKFPANEETASPANKYKSVNVVVEKANQSSNRSNTVTKDKRLLKTSLFVKVNMDGIPIGRKVDLNAHSCYGSLIRTLDDMFKLDAAIGTTGSKLGEHVDMDVTKQLLRLDGSSDFVLTYEDKEGDWMLVGDVPWEMFLCCVRRLRIRSTTEAS